MFTRTVYFLCEGVDHLIFEGDGGGVLEELVYAKIFPTGQCFCFPTVKALQEIFFLKSTPPPLKKSQIVRL